MTISGDRRIGALVGLAVLIVVLGLGGIAAAQTIFYVDGSASPGGDGSTWALAYASLQDALTAAQTPSLTGAVQIWVAAGAYTPGSTQDDSFRLHDHVAVYGGFPADSHASEPGWSARDPSANETILSGDIGTQGDASDNCFHVVKSNGNDSSAVLDGFTVTGGTDDTDNGYGGGMLNTSSSPTVTNCTFDANKALKYGGGMYNNASSPEVTHCAFTDNYVGYSSSAGAYGYGGGMYNTNGSSPQVRNCTFNKNEALESGGAMYNADASSPTITDCTFIENTAGASWDGGAVCSWDSPSTLSDCTFTGNTAGSGGGIYFAKTAVNYSITISRCTFDSNNATYDGGGVCTRGVDLTLLDCIVAGNSAKSGGGLYASNCNLTLTNAVFSGNLAEGDMANNGLGGGIYNNGYSSFTQILTNVTFSGNRAANTDLGVTGGALYNAYSNPDIRNCIFWNNEDSSGIGTLTASVSNDDSTPTFSSSLIQGVEIVDGVGWDNAAGINGGGNLNLDPQFITPVNPSAAPTTAGNLQLQSDSPAIDAGDTSFVTEAIDLAGHPRIVDGTLDGTATVDLGAYEFQPGGAAKGDVNGDGVINILDVRLCLQIAEGVIPGTAAQRQQADMNGDGQVTLADAQQLAQYVMMH